MFLFLHVVDRYGQRTLRSPNDRPSDVDFSVQSEVRGVLYTGTVLPADQAGQHRENHVSSSVVLNIKL